MRTSSARINGAIALLVERAQASGDIRPDADSADLLRALIGFAYVNSTPDWEASARRLIDLLIDGLRSQRGEQYGATRSLQGARRIHELWGSAKRGGLAT